MRLQLLTHAPVGNLLKSLVHQASPGEIFPLVCHVFPRKDHTARSVRQASLLAGLSSTVTPNFQDDRLESGIAVNCLGDPLRSVSSL